MTVLTATRLALKDVLFATDFSRVSTAALPYAMQIARVYDSNLHLVHVLVPAEWQPVPEAMPVGMGAAAADQAERCMAELVENTAWGDVRHDDKVQKGIDVWRTLAHMVRSEHMGLIVVGTHGREGLRRWLVGSIAEEVFRTAACPVLVIGPRAAYHKPKPFRKLLFATDLTEESLRALPFVEDFAADHEAKLFVCHVPPDKPVTHAERTLAAESVRKWMRDLIPPRPDIEYVVPFGDTGTAILDAAENKECDLILLGAHPATGFSTHLPGNVAHTIVAEAYCPVLIVHPLANQ
jgi:nucleotide-binding universal stress UspA family protein